jgi:hypothetical protein
MRRVQDRTGQDALFFFFSFFPLYRTPTPTPTQPTHLSRCFVQTNHLLRALLVLPCLALPWIYRSAD